MQFQFAYAVSSAAANARADAASERSHGGASIGESVAAWKHADDIAGKSGGQSRSGLTQGMAARNALHACRGESGDPVHKASVFQAILKKIKNSQPDVSMYGRINVTNGARADEAPLLSRAANLGGDGVRVGKVADLVLHARVGRISSKAGLPPTRRMRDAGFAVHGQGQYEDRFRTSTQLAAAFAHEVMREAVGTMRRAVSIDAPKVLVATPSARLHNGTVGAVAFDDKGDLKEGAITVHDFKDSGIAVLEAVGA
ncbi:hypothetical protein FAZ69_25020 [Trinickia terrae]|uniref:Uncharacterized protein n=1 Tax=Trinickia terrae TaxID=2571161 RepID=A0A4U1HNN6_9BURK|nr:hypothetical protein [Trinickia terrae]TKC82969.1 hypothetical protein FAZ69_25020 [Trinickia terrae]